MRSNDALNFSAAFPGGKPSFLCKMSLMSCDFVGLNIESTLYSHSLPKSVLAIPSLGFPTCSRLVATAYFVSPRSGVKL